MRRLALVPILAALALVLLVPPAPAGAQGAEPSEADAVLNASILLGEPAGQPLAGEALDRETEHVSSLMRCPVCQGMSVADSTTRTAMAMKEEVRDLLAAGYTKAQTLDYFVQSYGEFILLEPKAEGFNLVVWLAPIAALLVGAGLVAWRLRSRAPHARAAADGPGDEEGELAGYLEQVRREVRQ